MMRDNGDEQDVTTREEREREERKLKAQLAGRIGELENGDLPDGPGFTSTLDETNMTVDPHGQG